MSLIGTVAKAAVAAPLAWMAYSRFGIDHDVELPKAIDADQRTVRTIAAGDISYYVDDEASGRPLVLIHSVNAAANPREMQPLFDHYKGTRPVYAIDLPGFGFSGRYDVNYTPTLFVDAIGEFLLSEIGQPADVVALSLGCEFVAQAALENPDLFSSLVFISPTGLAADPPEIDPTRSVKRSLSADVVYKLVSFPLWSQAVFDLVVTKPSIRYFSPSKNDGPNGQSGSYEYKTAHQPGAKFVPLLFISGKLYTAKVAEKVYAKLTVPVLSLYGQDRYTTFDKMPRLHEKNSDWHSFRFDENGSMIHQESPAITTAAMDEFWTRVDKAKSGH